MLSEEQFKASISADLVKLVLYGSPGGNRFTQDSPVLPEVWTRLAERPLWPVDGMIVPHHARRAHHVADELHLRLQQKSRRGAKNHSNAVSDIPGLVTATVDLDEIVNVIMPLTAWWQRDKLADWIETFSEAQIAEVVAVAFGYLSKADNPSACHLSERLELPSGFSGGEEGNLKTLRQAPDSMIRILILIAMIEAVRRDSEGRQDMTGDEAVRVDRLDLFDPSEIEEALKSILEHDELRARAEMRAMPNEDTGGKRDLHLVFTLSLNRRAEMSSMPSVNTTKADAAYRVFDISTSGITWAVIDSGIDAIHPAFYRFRDEDDRIKNSTFKFFDKEIEPEDSRVKAKYDLTILTQFRNRDLVHNTAGRQGLIDTVARNWNSKIKDRAADQLSEEEKKLYETATHAVGEVFADLADGRPFDWEKVEPLLAVDLRVKPKNEHGTHVAGILGGAWLDPDEDDPVRVYGMCRDISLIDMMVVGENAETTEFAVISAQRLVRHLNQRHAYFHIHGVNISMSIPHDVTNYACGRTEVCAEAENLVNNGVVVVAAAGNRGFNQFHTADGVVDLHTGTSITDPGNAELVITVGSTHRLAPHNYGVSFFSSRGPTGDGRIKPDLVAPGEKIRAPVCNLEYAVLEGTSMAAPHVSGAAAMLMSRFEELIGNPQRIKKILCQSSTDLGRERTFQGCGLVDVLRALQSV